MSGPQSFFFLENGEVIHWDIHDPPIKLGPSAVDMFGPIACVDEPIEVTDPEYARGYQNALKDVLNEVMRSGKQHLVQWLEQQLKALP